MELKVVGRALFSLVRTSLPWLFSILVMALLTWQYPNYRQGTHSTQKSDRETLLIPELSIQKTAYLIKLAEPSITNNLAWAKDLRRALDENHLAFNRENVCAMVAIIGQESSFKENPRAQILTDKAIRAFAEKLAKIPQLGYQNALLFIKWLKRNPKPDNSYWRQLSHAKTQQELDRTYRAIILEHLALQSKENSNLLQNNLSFRDLIEHNNNIVTLGSMQVALDFAIQAEEQRLKHPLTLNEVWKLRDRMYSRKDGMYYGALLLLGYDVGYDKKLYRFADFNAGRFASRNAAFQAIAGELLAKQLSTDGDLLIYDKQGKPTATVSNSEQAIIEIVQKYQLGLTVAQIRSDLLQEKQLNFNHTATFKAVTGYYKKSLRKSPPVAVVPNIVLRGEKTAKTLSTAKFANTVNTRFQHCTDS